MSLQWQVDEDGGYLANPDLSAKIRAQAYGKMVMRQFGNPIEGGFGKQKSDKVQFARYNKVTTAGGSISESDTIPTTQIVMSRGEVVVDEYGNSVEYTGKLQALAEFDPSNITQAALMDDMAATLDLEIRNLLKLGGVAYTPLTATTGTWSYNGTPAGQGVDVQVYHLRAIKQGMKELNIKPFDDAGNYILIGGPAVVAALQGDSEWRDAAHYGDPERIFTGETGKLYGFRVVEESQSLLSPGMVSEGTAGAAGEAYALGADAFVEAVATPPELRYQNADYGREQGIAWYGLMGWAHTWDMTGGANSWSGKSDAKGKVRYIRIDGT